jgi:hypothetical protein
MIKILKSKEYKLYKELQDKVNSLLNCSTLSTSLDLTILKLDAYMQKEKREKVFSLRKSDIRID